jgi:hypothetical protein
VSDQRKGLAALLPKKGLWNRISPGTGLEVVERRKILSLVQLEFRPLGNEARS